MSLIIFILIIILLPSCNNNKVYEFDNYSDVDDNDDFWNSYAYENVTYREYITSDIQKRIKFYLISLYLFDKYNLSLSDEEKSSIQNTIDEIVKEYGDRNQANKDLKSEYGISLWELKSILTVEQKYTKVYNYLFGSSGIMSSTNQEIDDYYKNNYSRIKYVILFKNKKYKTDDSGKRIVDDNGNYVFENLTVEEKSEVIQLANEIFNNVSNNINIDGYSDPIDYYIDTVMNYENFNQLYPHGFYISYNNYNLHTLTVTNAAVNMKAGETLLEENEDCFFIIKKYDLIDKAYLSQDDSVQFLDILENCNSVKFESYFNTFLDQITINEKNNTIVIN